VFFNPNCDRAIIRACRNESPERLGINAGELEKVTVERAVKVILAKCARNGSTAFVEHAGSKDVASQQFAWAARVFLDQVFCF
jgi:hypothetical protein